MTNPFCACAAKCILGNLRDRGLDYYQDPGNGHQVFTCRMAAQVSGEKSQRTEPLKRRRIEDDGIIIEEFGKS